MNCYLGKADSSVQGQSEFGSVEKENDALLWDLLVPVMHLA